MCLPCTVRGKSVFFMNEHTDSKIKQKTRFFCIVVLSHDRTCEWLMSVLYVENHWQRPGLSTSDFPVHYRCDFTIHLSDMIKNNIDGQFVMSDKPVISQLWYYYNSFSYINRILPHCRSEVNYQSNRLDIWSSFYYQSLFICKLTIYLLTTWLYH